MLHGVSNLATKKLCLLFGLRAALVLAPILPYGKLCENLGKWLECVECLSEKGFT